MKASSSLGASNNEIGDHIHSNEKFSHKRRTVLHGRVGFGLTKFVLI